MTCSLTNLAAPARFAIPSSMAAARKIAGALPSLAGTFSPKVGGLAQRCRALDRVPVRAMTDINVGHSGTEGGDRSEDSSNAGSSSDAGQELQRQDDRSSVSRRGDRGKRDGGEFEPIGSLLGDFWDPLLSSRSLRQMIDMVDRFFDDARMFPTTRGASPARAVRVPWDIVEDDQAFYIRVDVPGFSKQDVTVSVEDHSLVIDAQKKEGGHDKFGARSYAKFFTRAYLPENVKSNAIKAELKHGVLYLTVPKTEDKKKVLDVKVVSDDNA